MWLLWRKANQFHKLPSEVFGEDDPLAAWMLDNAVMYFGTIIENMLQERDEIAVGNSKSYAKRYTLSRLLDETFLYPSPEAEDDVSDLSGTEGLMYDEME